MTRKEEKWYTFGIITMMLKRHLSKEAEVIEEVEAHVKKIAPKLHLAFYNGRMDMAVWYSRNKKRNG